MKKIIFLLIVFFAFEANAQEVYSLSRCRQDTLLYLEMNYEKNHDRDIGKTVGEFARTLELPVSPDQIGLSYYERRRVDDPNVDGLCDGFNLEFFQGDVRYDLTVMLESPYAPLTWEMGREMEERGELTWDMLVNHILGGCRIRAIYLYKRPGGFYSPTYSVRRPL